MKPWFDVIIVMPVGPNSSVAFIEDTVVSYHHFTKSSYKIIFADDSQQGIGNCLQTIFPHADVITTKKSMVAGLACISRYHWRFAIL